MQTTTTMYNCTVPKVAADMVGRVVMSLSEDEEKAYTVAYVTPHYVITSCTPEVMCETLRDQSHHIQCPGTFYSSMTTRTYTLRFLRAVWESSGHENAPCCTVGLRFFDIGPDGLNMKDYELYPADKLIEVLEEEWMETSMESLKV